MGYLFWHITVKRYALPDLEEGDGHTHNLLSDAEMVNQSLVLDRTVLILGTGLAFL